MFSLTQISPRAREAIKTALGISIAYAVSLSMGWDKPLWAGFTVAFISLATVGHSIRRGILRLLGTLAAGVAALTLIALFAQQRWLLMVALTLYIGFCTYRMLGSRNPYFYFVAAFVCVIILFTGGVESLSAFDTVMARIQETGMGIGVYTLIAVFLWPRSTDASVDDSSRKLVAVQQQLFQAYRGSMAGIDAGTDANGDIRTRQMQHAQLSSALAQALDGAEADSYAVRRMRGHWHRFESVASALGEALERWRTSLVEVDGLDLQASFPNLEVFFSELDSRYTQIGRVLNTQQPERMPTVVRVELSRPEADALTHFQRAALATTQVQLERIERLSRELFDCVMDLKNPEPTPWWLPGRQAGGSMFAIDPDRFSAVIRVTAGLWMGFLVWIYADPPASGLLIIFIVAVGMLLVQMPWVPVWKLSVPFAVGALFGGIIYIFVMPQLTSYIGLGSLIFMVTFAIAYLFAAPRLMVLRGSGLAMFLLFISVDNQQAYSFAGYANQVVAIFLATFILIIAANFPASPRPEKVFRRLVTRFFRHAEFLIARLSVDWKQEQGWLKQAKSTIYQHDILQIPRKLSVWGAQIDTQAFPENTPERVQALVNSLDVLAHRINILTEARRSGQADFLVHALLQDVRAWRLVLQDLLRAWSKAPAFADKDGQWSALEQTLVMQVEKMEVRIRATFDQTGKPALSDQDYQNFYHLIGAFRLVNEAVIAHGRLAPRIDWTHWQQVRF
jgi:uncharacterized membrane protein YccC